MDTEKVHLKLTQTGDFLSLSQNLNHEATTNVRRLFRVKVGKCTIGFVLIIIKWFIGRNFPEIIIIGL